MTRDDIIRMADEAGITPWERLEYIGGKRFSSTDEGLDGDLTCLIQFATLVAAAEREAILKDGWRQCAKDQRTTQFCGMLQQAVLTEREACAKLCEEPGWNAANWCAAQIRARGRA